MLLILDEIQKIPRWSDTVKKLWDQDTRNKIDLKIMLLGSSPLLRQAGLTESLAGRFEIIHAPHWSLTEMQEAFNFNLEQYIYYGGYPGAADLIKDHQRWKNYILNSLIETTISRDVLLMTRVDKPALLRRLFELACNMSGQVVAFQKMLGQLYDAGNASTLAHYLELLSGAGMVSCLQKFSGGKIRQRGSMPKLQVALITSQNPQSLEQVKQNPQSWGRLVESAIGAHLFNSVQGTNINLFYWREGNFEVDFVLQQGSDVIAFEVKSGSNSSRLNGMREFDKRFHPKCKLLVGADGISIGNFLSNPIQNFF